MNQQQHAVRLGIGNTLAILWPYFRDNLVDQFKTIWFIVVYLAFFQIFVLGLPIVYAAMIGFGIVVVAVGLMFFMEGLRLGLMPLGETIGAVLPRNSPLPLILGFAFLLGVGATFAEPAIAILKQAGGGVRPVDAPLLYSLLNDFSGQLVSTVGIGVGIAVLLGILRFFYGWSLKILIIPTVCILLALTIFAHSDPVLQPILGLAWDCGAVTTGPVTVPLVLALGIGVCRIVGDGETSHAGFGIVTLASLAPIVGVILLALYHYQADDYFGRPAYLGESANIQPADPEPPSAKDTSSEVARFSQDEFEQFLVTGLIEKDYRIRYEGGRRALGDGRIILRDTDIILEKKPKERPTLVSAVTWDPNQDAARGFLESLAAAGQAIIPLCLFLFITLKLVLKEPLRNRGELSIGVGFAVLGMTLFVLGITLGLSPLATQLGSNVPATFASLTPWGMSGFEGPLFATAFYGKLVATSFGFFLGYGATLAEPALNALGDTVEKITVGAFRKGLLMQSVAIGVGAGIAMGVLKIAYNIPLSYLLVPPYLLLLVLTWFSSEEFVNFGWDSAGVATGPITVPLVLAMGLGIGANVPGVIDGFGILALASVGPIITVLSVGFIVSRTSQATPQRIERGG
ncbi:MAG: DUF1538 domain-containing protein [Pseudomonadota bacterium]|nr:DUF1538 domain-containing protein [Pseudomonadota bacterium]